MSVSHFFPTPPPPICLVRSVTTRADHCIVLFLFIADRRDFRNDFPTTYARSCRVLVQSETKDRKLRVSIPTYRIEKVELVRFLSPIQSEAVFLLFTFTLFLLPTSTDPSCFYSPMRISTIVATRKSYRRIGCLSKPSHVSYGYPQHVTSVS
jgi:hypothetical protein